MKGLKSLIGLVCVGAVTISTHAAKKPNFLIIWGDDIGVENISAYSHGIMGYKTPNIDRIAKEGMMFTDYYAEQSCTAGRSAFITGQATLRTGLSKVGLPGAKAGLQDRDITIAEVLKTQGYVTGQFGKNHLGDRDEFLPTRHGFDEFYGNLYHLNAEEEPEDPDYPKDKAFKKKFGPRGVLHSFADGKVKDTGPLTKKRMETVDEDIVNRSIKFITNAAKKKKPFFVWVNTTGMHYRTHPRPEAKGLSGQGDYNDVFVQHDMYVGRLLDSLEKNKVKDNTFVMYSTDNGVHYNTWPDAGITKFRSEKNTNWEGAYRVPALVMFPGKIKAGEVSNEIVSSLDWMPTIATWAGVKNLKKDLLKGKRIGKKKAKLHLDGYDLSRYLEGKQKKSPRKEFIYLDDQGVPVAVRMGDWKVVFSEQRAKTMALWAEPFVDLRVSKVFNLRRDPYERADQNSNTYWDWMQYKAAYVYMAMDVTAKFLDTFKKYPASQTADSWSMKDITKNILQHNKKK
ncbi:arylsulfatase [Bacteriovorax sp. BAL6_X]|uniref:arylsulfatase n=1 Tax=Bacteriovorax sp. BAL6_X TaxID=1201290 RepID=UPI000385F86E|nr:arylsulfatase [Bacteriovorax sp. BAL6_X]EPZ50774.1 arylsulfatase [Bacteriovorax sp. BAL6_X]